MSELHDRLTDFNKGLLPEMVQLKYEAIADNAFRFFRGTCHLFYEDLAVAEPLPLFPLAWIFGDRHIENEDRDPQNIIVIDERGTFPDCMIEEGVVGALKAEQTERDGKTMRNDRFIGIAVVSQLYAGKRPGDAARQYPEPAGTFFSELQ
jgi:inorganic pyrophosphatase